MEATITALLREREALRAALPTVEQLDELMAFDEGWCPACWWQHGPDRDDGADEYSCWLARLRTLLTGTTARTD